MKPKSLTFDMHFDKAECYLILNRYKADNTLAIDLYIEKYRKIKETSKGAQRQLAKLFLSSLYGKMATSPESSHKIAYQTDDNTLAIDLVSTYGEPITRLTVCVNNGYKISKAPDNISFIDIYNNPTAMNFIDEYKLGEPVRINGRIVVYKSGFCVYPLYKFNLDELRKYAILDNSKT